MIRNTIDDGDNENQDCRIGDGKKKTFPLYRNIKVEKALNDQIRSNQNVTTSKCVCTALSSTWYRLCYKQRGFQRFF